MYILKVNIKYIFWNSAIETQKLTYIIQIFITFVVVDFLNFSLYIYINGHCINIYTFQKTNNIHFSISYTEPFIMCVIVYTRCCDDTLNIQLNFYKYTFIHIHWHIYSIWLYSYTNSIIYNTYNNIPFSDKTVLIWSFSVTRVE